MEEKLRLAERTSPVRPEHKASSGSIDTSRQAVAGGGNTTPRILPLRRHVQRFHHKQHCDTHPQEIDLPLKLDTMCSHPDLSLADFLNYCP